MSLVNRQPHTHVDVTHTNTPFLSTESTVAVQCDDEGPWTHGMVVGQGFDHKNRN